MVAPTGKRLAEAEPKFPAIPGLAMDQKRLGQRQPELTLKNQPAINPSTWQLSKALALWLLPKPERTEPRFANEPTYAALHERVLGKPAAIHRQCLFFYSKTIFYKPVQKDSDKVPQLKRIRESYVNLKINRDGYGADSFGAVPTTLCTHNLRKAGRPELTCGPVEHPERQLERRSGSRLAFSNFQENRMNTHHNIYRFQCCQAILKAGRAFLVFGDAGKSTRKIRDNCYLAV